jgi:hypothetical protein
MKVVYIEGGLVRGVHSKVKYYLGPRKVAYIEGGLIREVHYIVKYYLEP